MDTDMKLIIKPYRALPCSLEVFTINDQSADVDDFGTCRDTWRAMAEPCGCGRMEFIPDMANANKCMAKYGITLEQFYDICDELKSKLYVGQCRWCV